MERKDLKTICVDLDGTLAKYRQWVSMTEIGEAFDGAAVAVEELYEKYQICIFTARLSSQMLIQAMKDGGLPQVAEKGYKGNVEVLVNEARDVMVQAIEKWCNDNGIKFDNVSGEKETAEFYIDNRAIEFKDWPQVLRRIRLKEQTE